MTIPDTQRYKIITYQFTGIFLKKEGFTRSVNEYNPILVRKNFPDKDAWP
jgi:hypothetical protein